MSMGCPSKIIHSRMESESELQIAKMKKQD